MPKTETNSNLARDETRMARHTPTRQVVSEISNFENTQSVSETAPVCPEKPGRNQKPSGAMRILSSIGEVVYEWSIADDVIRWGANALEVLGLSTYDGFDSGRKYAALLSPENLTTPYDSIVDSTMVDSGTGVPYQIEYEMMLPGEDGDRKLWIEDTGRWFAGDNGRPARAHGVLRVIDASQEDEHKQAYLRRFDPLTGEMNRARLIEVLDETLKNSQRLRIDCAFLVISLDNLTAINETYGFDIADGIIAKVAGRIKTRLRGGDSIGRFSGNKFGVVLMNCGRDDIETAAERFLSSVTDEVISTEQGTVAATVTIGGVCLPGAVKSAHDAMAFAQEALDAAKLRGRESFVCYEASRMRMTERKNNVSAASGILQGLNEERVRVAYQPVMDANCENVAFHECLMRLEQNDGTVIEAGTLMPVAEKLGLVRLIDLRMLTLVLDELAAFPETMLSVNLSTQTVVKSDWLDALSAALRRLPGDLASRLIVEFNETAAIDSPDETGEFVSRLHALGAKVAIDDFGAGQTSLRNLKTLGVDFVKIDGALVENLAGSEGDQVLVRALVELAKAFEIETVAKWVSDAASVGMLKEMGVNYLQGNYLASAVLAQPWKTEATTEPSEDLASPGPEAANQEISGD